MVEKKLGKKGWINRHRGVTMVFLKEKHTCYLKLVVWIFGGQSTVPPLRSSLTLRRAPYTNMKNVMHPNEVDHIELTLHHGKRRADRHRIAQ